MSSFPSHYQPSYLSPYPDRPVYRAANAYANSPVAFPAAMGFIRAAGAGGDATNKVEKGMGGIIHGVVYKKGGELYGKGLAHLYKTHPGLADTVNRHPILTGIPVTLLGVALCSAPAYLAENGFYHVMEKTPGREFLRKGVDQIGRTPLGGLLGKAWNAVTHPVSLGVMALGLLGFTAVYTVRRLQDSWAFGRDYQQARKELPKASPYLLRDAVALNRQYGNAVKHPQKSLKPTNPSSLSQQATKVLTQTA